MVRERERPFSRSVRNTWVRLPADRAADNRTGDYSITGDTVNLANGRLIEIVIAKCDTSPIKMIVVKTIRVGCYAESIVFFESLFKKISIQSEKTKIRNVEIFRKINSINYYISIFFFFENINTTFFFFLFWTQFSLAFKFTQSFIHKLDQKMAL